jgi:hypothetical protein
VVRQVLINGTGGNPQIITNSIKVGDPAAQPSTYVDGVFSDGTYVWATNYSTIGTISKFAINTRNSTIYSYNYGSNDQWTLDVSLNGFSITYQFGYTLALNSAGDRLSVGAQGAPNPPDLSGGKVFNYVYTNANKWQNIFNVAGISGNGPHIFGGGNTGQAIALSGLGNRLVIADHIYQATSTISSGVVYSYDEPLAGRQCNAIAANNSLVVAGGASIRNPLAYSLDGGQTWTDSVSGGPNLFVGGDVSANIWGLQMNVSYNQCNAVEWNGSIWVAGGSGKNALAYSYDGLNWLPSSFTGLATCTTVTWNSTFWLAVGLLSSDMTAGQAYSSDGITWILNSNSVTLTKALAARRYTNRTLQANPQAGTIVGFVKGVTGDLVSGTYAYTYFTPLTNGICLIYFNFVTQNVATTTTTSSLYILTFSIIQNGITVATINGSPSGTKMASALSGFGYVVAGLPVRFVWTVTTDTGLNIKVGAINAFGNYLLMPSN